MSDTLDKIEILIGKFLDGELSPKERCLLDSEIERDRHAKDLFEQMRLLHECGCGVVTQEVLERGADPADVFERAWQQSKRSFWRRIARGGLQRKGWLGGARADGHLRFAVGLAAGLVLGLIFQFVPVPLFQSLSNLPSQPQVAVENVPPGTFGQSGIVPVRQPADLRQVQRMVDWYVYTDRAGNQWLIEGTREGTAKPAAAYRDGL